MQRLRDAVPHVLRALAMAMAALALTSGVTVTGGLIAAMVGAALGVALGQRLGTSRTRMSVIIGGAALLLFGSWTFAAAAVASEAIPRAVGPANALHLASIVRFGALALCVVGAF